MRPKWHPIWDTTMINHADSAGKWLTSTSIAEVKLLWWLDKSKPMSAIQYLAAGLPYDPQNQSWKTSYN